MTSGRLHVTVQGLLTLEEMFPGLMKDIDVCIWQIELIKAQMKAEADG